MSSQEAASQRKPEPLSLVSDIPVVCVPGLLTQEERTAHLQLSTDALSRWPVRKHEMADGYLFEYEGNEERFLALARWVSAEHRCCPWASYSVEMGPSRGSAPGTLRLRVSATEEGAAFLRTCYEYIEKINGTLPQDSPFTPDRVAPITPAEVQRELER